MLYSAPGSAKSAGTLGTVHKVIWPDDDKGQAAPGQCAPEFGPGELLTRENLSAIHAALSGGKIDRSILPECVLSIDQSLLCWFRPAQHKPIFFATQKKGFDAKMSGKTALHPPLVFAARPGRLSVWSLGSSWRPTADSALYQAPYFNVYADGSMCAGTSPIPKTAELNDIDGFEAALYGSAFTHTNMGNKEITSHPKGHAGLWDELVHTHHRVFPFHFLLPAKSSGNPLTLGEAIARL
jgi:PRTRC genetic system protein B